MSFKEDSQKIMTFITNHFKKFCNKYDKDEKKLNDTILKSLYNDIKEADANIELLNKTNKIRKDIIENPSNKIETELIESKFVPTEIKEYIETHNSGLIKYSTIINGRDLTLKFNLESILKKSNKINCGTNEEQINYKYRVK